MSAYLLDPMRKDGSFPFKYSNSASTNVRETFERVRRERAAEPSKIERLPQRKARNG